MGERASVVELPPEGRRSPTLLDLGIAIDADEIAAAARDAGPSVAGLTHDELHAEHDRLVAALDVPDGWALMYRDALRAWAELPAAPGEHERLVAGRAEIEAVAAGVRAWWSGHRETAGRLAAVEAALACRLRERDQPGPGAEPATPGSG